MEERERLSCPMSDSGRECREEKCAWWNQVKEQCAVLALAATTPRTSLAGEGIASGVLGKISSPTAKQKKSGAKKKGKGILNSDDDV